MTGPAPLETREEDAAAKGEVYLEQWRALPRCERCQRKLRPVRALRSVWPATVARASGGACTACYNAGFRDSKGRRRPQPSSATRHMVGAVPVSASRAESAASWTPAERSFALLVCDRDLNSAEILQIFDMFGLWQDPADREIERNIARRQDNIDTRFGDNV